MTELMIFWAILFVLLVVAEFSTMQLVSIWFALGALGAFIAAFFNLGFTAQLAIFVLCSLLMLLITRPLLRNIKVQEVAPMNAQRDIGAQAVIIEEVNPALGTGRARINGVDWTAVSANGSVIPKNSIVIVDDIDGAKLVVSLQKTITAAMHSEE